MKSEMALEWKKYIPNQDHIEILENTNVKTYTHANNTTFVSPSNSLLFFDGGIDYVYSRVMFLNLEKDAKQMVKDTGLLSKLGRPWLPIGETLTIPLKNNNYMICSPTMMMPQNVRNTQNAYYATKAALLAAKQNNVEQLIIPGMCTGYGKMTCEEAAKQMARAITEFYKDDYNLPSREIILAEQPNYYENTEFKDIDVTDIILH